MEKGVAIRPSTTTDTSIIFTTAICITPMKTTSTNTNSRLQT